MRTVSIGRTDVGRRRPHNEDSYLCDDELGLYIVADGVGGNAKGEVASAESVDLVHSWVRRWRATLESHRASPTDESTGLVRRLLESAVQSACYMVFGMGQLDPRQKGMSSTLSSLLVSADNGFIAQVGDSRVYLARAGKVVQLTEDHTLVNFRLKLGLITPEEAASAPGKNVITRAVGHQDYVEVDTLDLRTERGDRFLLCSDGLHGYLQDGELEQLIDGDRHDVAKALIDLANDRGGRDNVTVVVCDIEE
jgi:serine/threonine protein phosphatase PrpC